MTCAKPCCGLRRACAPRSLIGRDSMPPSPRRVHEQSQEEQYDPVQRTTSRRARHVHFSRCIIASGASGGQAADDAGRHHVPAVGWRGRDLAERRAGGIHRRRLGTSQRARRHSPRRPPRDAFAHLARRHRRLATSATDQVQRARRIAAAMDAGRNDPRVHLRTRHGKRG